MKLLDNVRKEDLVKFGFSSSNDSVFRMQKNLFKNLIAMRIEVDLDERTIDYEVFDRNNQSLYAPFYYNLNGENNLVAIKVADAFRAIVKKLEQSKIIKMEDKNNDDEKDNRNGAKN